MRRLIEKMEFPAFTTMWVIPAALLVGVLAGCASAPQPRIEAPPATVLSGYHTFGFHDSLPMEQDGSYPGRVNARLRESTRAELERHGFVYSEHNPDLKVNFDVQVRERQELRRVATSHGIFVRRAGLQDYDLVPYRQGTVSIDLVDNRLKSVIWQGAAMGRADSGLSGRRGPDVDEAVRQIFVGFPRPRD